MNRNSLISAVTFATIGVALGVAITPKLRKSSDVQMESLYYSDFTTVNSEDGSPIKCSMSVSSPSMTQYSEVYEGHWRVIWLGSPGSCQIRLSADGYEETYVPTSAIIEIRRGASNISGGGPLRSATVGMKKTQQAAASNPY